jgi:c(7)-type cytochrome triheme protein
MTRRRAMARGRLMGAPLLVGLVLLVTLAALALPARLRIPKLAPRPPGTPRAAAAFSHARHSVMACYMCHPSLFPQTLQGFSHGDMRQGRYCGACHDGAGAAAIEAMACQECHAEP